jgi:hypothetical protein
MNVFGLKARRRIRDAEPIRKPKSISRAGPGTIGNQLMPSSGRKRHGKRLLFSIDQKLDTLMNGRP